MSFDEPPIEALRRLATEMRQEWEGSPPHSDEGIPIDKGREWADRLGDICDQLEADAVEQLEIRERTE